MSTRPDKETYFMAMAYVAATRATCTRRRVGCILVDDLDHVCATGYNGVPMGMTHCTDEGCPGARSKSGSDLDLCLATHAEQNALLQCQDVYRLKWCFTTTLPCVHCLKLLMNTSCKVIYYVQTYQTDVISLWLRSRGDRDLVQIDVFKVKRLLEEMCQ